MCVSSSSSAVGRGHRRSSAILLSLSALLLLFSFFSSSTFPPSPSACVRLCGRMWSECGLWGRESSWSTVPRLSLPHYPALIHGDDTVFIIVVYAELRLHSESLSDLSLHESDSIHTFSYVWDFTAEWVRDWDSYHKFLCSRLLSQQYQCIVQQRSISSFCSLFLFRVTLMVMVMVMVIVCINVSWYHRLTISSAACSSTVSISVKSQSWLL